MGLYSVLIAMNIKANMYEKLIYKQIDMDNLTNIMLDVYLFLLLVIIFLLM